MNFKKALEKAKRMFNCTYVLSYDEISIWKNIEQKANQGLYEWQEQTKGDDLCGPWISNITPDEIYLIDKIHKLFYGDDWIIYLPISVAQVNYIMYIDIKNKVK